MTLKNQFAQNIKKVWLEMEIKKRIQTTSSICISEVRAEVSLSIEASRDIEEATTNNYEYEVHVLSTKSESKNAEMQLTCPNSFSILNLK